MGDDLGRVLDDIVKRFNEGRTGPRVETGYQGDYNLLKQKIHMSLKAGNPPDLAQMYESWTAYYNLEKGKEGVVSLDSFLAQSPDMNLEDIYPVFIQDNTWDGKIWSFPCTKSLPVLYYNKDMFQKDIHGMSYVVDPWILECMVLQQGAKLSNSDSDVLPFTRPEFVKALTYFDDAVRGPDAYAVLQSGREFQNDYVAQKAAMILTTSVSKAFMVDRIKFDWGMAPLPTWGQKASIMAGTNVGIFRHSSPEKQKVAWEFIKFFSSPEINAYWAIHTGYVPVRRSAVESESFKKYLEKDSTSMAAISQIEYATFEPRSPAWYEMRDHLAKAIENTLRGQMKVDEALTWATEKMKATMAAQSQPASPASTTP
jgi:multiple sugar transport system substrate-binding protein